LTNSDLIIIGLPDFLTTDFRSLTTQPASTLLFSPSIPRSDGEQYDRKYFRKLIFIRIDFGDLGLTIQRSNPHLTKKLAYDLVIH
jgi:hypothetical protein